MLRRHQTAAGPVIHRSTLFDERNIPHAFSTRIGGISTGPFASLNLGNPNGCPIQDSTDNIARNYRLLLESVECAHLPIARVHQVHGKKLAWLRQNEPFAPGTQADGILSDDPTRGISVRVADCVPILLASGDGSAVAAVHAGWRGVVAGIAIEAVGELCERCQHGPGELIAAIGPCIGPDEFEVGPEVLEAFVQAFGAAAPIRNRPSGKGDVDLKVAVRLQLLRAGLDPSNIDVSDRCTARDADEFYSHRRDNGVTGRMAAIIIAGRR